MPFSSYRLYLIEILHQTTTTSVSNAAISCCILSKFYIKPQHRFDWFFFFRVVSYRNSTSNHNSVPIAWSVLKLYLIEILHQTTTTSTLYVSTICCILSKFYIKPQRNINPGKCIVGCILSKFYIKPQLSPQYMSRGRVVSYRNSTSNHNRLHWSLSFSALYLIEILHQTTTSRVSIRQRPELYLIEILHQTTTIGVLSRFAFRLYLIEILHQTTTPEKANEKYKGCILSKFYIKPQRRCRKHRCT